MDIKKLAEDLVNAQEAISTTTKLNILQNEKLAKLDTRLNNLLGNSEQLNKGIVTNLNYFKGVNNKHVKDISDTLDKLVNTAFEKNKREIRFTIEKQTRLVLYFTIIPLVIALLSLLTYFITRPNTEDLRNTIESNSIEINQLKEDLKYIENQFPKQHKQLLNHKNSNK